MRRLSTIGVLVLALLVVTAQPASAGIIVTDSFEDGNLNEYTQYRSANVTLQQDRTFGGDWALNLTTPDTTTPTAVVSVPNHTPSLDTYPEAGDSWSTFASFSGSDADVFHHYYWGVQNDSDDPWGYRLTFSTIQGTDALQAEIAKVKGGSASLDAGIVGDYDDYEELNVTVRWAADGTMNVSIANGTETKLWLNATDGEFDEGGIAYMAEGRLPIPSGADARATWDTPTVGDLRVYDVNTPNTLIQPGKVNATLYQRNTIIERETQTGIISMDGLEPGRATIAQLESDAYYDRQTVIENVRGNASVYLLDDTKSAIRPTFHLRDFVGLYPPDDSYLLVQRSVNENWTTVAGDYFGTPNRVSPTLEEDVRYRLVVVNPELGERRVLGPITPAGSVSIDLVVRTGNISVVGLGPSIINHPTTRVLPAVDNPEHFETHLERRDKPLDSWTITVTYTDPQGGETQLAQTSGTNPDGTTYEPNVNLSGREGGTVEVNVSYVLEGQRINDRTEFAVLTEYNNSYALLPLLASVDTRLPAQHVGVFKGFVAVLVTVFGTGAVAGTLRTSTEALGGVAVGFLAAFAILAWIPYTIVFVAGVTWLAFAGIRRGIG